MTDDRRCPVVGYDESGEGYAEMVREWIANPHAYFRAFGPEAREFQRRHRSERLRTMTLVSPASELAQLRPVALSLDGIAIEVGSWEQAFAQVVARLVPAHAQTFDALQRDGELAWLGAAAGGVSVMALLLGGGMRPEFPDLAEVVARIQWLFLMCGIRLNEVIVQVDPYTDGEWKLRKAEIDRRRRADKQFLTGRRAAQRAWREAHPGEADSATLL